MEVHSEETITDDLVSSEASRQTNALLKILQLCSSGRDLSIHLSNIVEYGLSQRQSSKMVRVLSYATLAYFDSTSSQSCTPSMYSKAAAQSTETGKNSHEWDRVIEIILKDLSTDDPDIRVALLKTIIHIPPHQLKSLCASSQLQQVLQDSLSNPDPRVRKAAVESLHVLLLYHKTTSVVPLSLLALLNSISSFTSIAHLPLAPFTSLYVH